LDLRLRGFEGQKTDKVHAQARATADRGGICSDNAAVVAGREFGVELAHMSHELDPYTFGAEQRCFGCGPHNEHGMRLRFRREGDEVLTEITAISGWDGPPKVFHGGLQATVADELAGWTLVGILGRMGFTTSMRVRYVRPMKIGVPILGRGSIASRKGPITTVNVRLEQEGKLGCSARVSYMLPDQDKAASYLGGDLPESWRHLFVERD
jgi:acyl-coenzyme A thioesterase PaaI-like protein